MGTWSPLLPLNLPSHNDSAWNSLCSHVWLSEPTDENCANTGALLNMGWNVSFQRACRRARCPIALVPTTWQGALRLQENGSKLQYSKQASCEPPYCTEGCSLLPWISLDLTDHQDGIWCPFQGRRLVMMRSRCGSGGREGDG